jgi:hypothetical protein
MTANDADADDARTLGPLQAAAPKFGAVSSSHWGALDGAGSAPTLAMSAVPWIPVVGTAAGVEAQ